MFSSKKISKRMLRYSSAAWITGSVSESSRPALISPDHPLRPWVVARVYVEKLSFL
jgi:hypothetical protein